MTVDVEPTPAPSRTPPAGPPLADLVLGLGALALFSAAFLQTLAWSFRTALFPRVVTLAGTLLAAAFVLGWLWSRRSRAAQSPDQDPQADTPELFDEDDVHDHEVEYVYATAGKAAWTQALAWVALFVVLLYVSGLFVAAAAFAFAYLRWAACRSWRFCAVYAAVMSGVLYLALGVLLVVPVPEGLFG